MAYVNLGQVMYPVGSIYQSWSATSPASLFGGQWTQIAEKFLFPSTSAGATGGAYTVTLNANQIPAHKHTLAIGDNKGNHKNIPALLGMSPVYTVPGTPDALHKMVQQNSSAYKVNGCVDNSGGNQAHENMPPFVRCYCWRKHGQ